jgi:TolB protein
MISADGSIVAFVSEARDLVRDQGYKQHPHDVFVYDRTSGIVTLVTHRDGSPSMPGDDVSDLTALSADGRFLAVSSFASDLLPGIQLPDDLFTGVLYLYDRVQGKPVLVSHAAGSPNRALGGFLGSLSADGRFLAFQSYDGGIVPGDGGSGTGTLEVYLYDRVGGATRLVSHAPGSPSTPSGAVDDRPVLSADGRFVAYSGGHAVLPPGSSHHRNIHLFDRVSGQTELISQSPRREEGSGDSSRPSISADGRYVAFLSQATNLTADPVTASPFLGSVSNNVYLYDRTAKKMTLVSRSFLPPFGGGNGVDSGVPENLDTGPVALSGGGFVLFSTVSSNLAPGDFNGAESDVFLYSPAP